MAAPLICRKHGLRLSKIMHNETQDGKVAADVHFAVATKFVERYIEEHKLDVVTPSELVQALNHGDGMKGAVSELYEMDIEHEETKRWTEAFGKKKEEGGLGDIGRVNEIKYMYDDVGGEEVYADTFTCKYSAPVRWKLGMYKSIRGSAVMGLQQP